VASQDPTSPADTGWVLIEGEPYKLIPYGSKTIDGNDSFTTRCHICRAALGAKHGFGCPLAPGLPYERSLQCRDCKVLIGELHVLNCGIEKRACCLGQYASCGCNSNEDAPDNKDEDTDGCRTNADNR